MKKLLSTIACGTVLATTASADFARIEMGAGAWMNTPDANLTYTDKGTYSSDKTANTDGYIWMFVKHPIPVIPNLRLEYVTMKDQGKAEGRFKDFTIPNLATAKFTMTQYDLIPYYNILDNTAWITLDLGVDLKIQETDYTVSVTKVFSGHSDKAWSVIPLLYVRGRVQIPITNIGIESDVKYITNGTSTVYDIRAKVDYTLDITPIIQPAIEIGYRVQKFDASIDNDKTKMSIDFSGVYAGLGLRF